MTLSKIFYYSCLLCVSLVFLSSCSKDDSDAKEAERAARAERIKIPVRTMVAEAGTVMESLSVQGRLEVWRQEILSTPVAGIIREFPSLPDQLIHEGELILRLDPPLNEAEEIIQAGIKLERANRSLERLKYLSINAPVTVSATDLEMAEDAASDAKHALELLTSRADKRIIKAPFTGVLVKFQGVVGDSIAEGTKFAEMLDISRYRIRLELPETSLRRLRLEQPVEVRALIDDAVAIGTVASIPAAIDSEKGTGQVVIDTRMPPVSWRPGGFATARLVLQETKGDVVVPRDKVFYKDNKAYCWSVDNSGEHAVAKRTWVTTGATDEKSIIIEKGIKTGDHIIVEGVAGLSDGVRIQVEKDEPDSDDKKTKPQRPSAEKQP